MNQYTKENHKRYTRKGDRGLLKVSRPCFTCGGNKHWATKCANTKSLGQNSEKIMMVTWSDNDDQEFVFTDKSSNDEDCALRLLLILIKYPLVKLMMFTMLLRRYPIKKCQISTKLCLMKPTLPCWKNDELTKNVSELRDEVESFRLVRSELGNKVTVLETKLHAMYERKSMCESEDEIDGLIASLEAHVHDLMSSHESLL